MGSPVSESPRHTASMRAQAFWQRHATAPPLATVERVGMTFVDAKVVGVRVQLKINEYEGQLMRTRTKGRAANAELRKLRSLVKLQRTHVETLKCELARRDELDGSSPEVALSLAHQTP